MHILVEYKKPFTTFQPDICYRDACTSATGGFGLVFIQVRMIHLEACILIEVRVNILN